MISPGGWSGGLLAGVKAVIQRRPGTLFIVDSRNHARARSRGNRGSRGGGGTPAVGQGWRAGLLDIIDRFAA